MVTKDDVRRLAMGIEHVQEKGENTYHFVHNGRNMVWAYPERVNPKKARVVRYDQFLFRVADTDDKLALLEGEPDIFFTADHYEGYLAVVARLDWIDEGRLQELILMAAEAAPLGTKG